MNCELRWTANFSATCLHAAYCRQLGLPATDPVLAEAIARPATMLVNTITETRLPVLGFMGELCNQAADHDDNHMLVKRAFARVVGVGKQNSASVAQLAGCVSELETALRRADLALVEQLRLRISPLRQQWEARGPGMLSSFARLTEPSLLAGAANVVLVLPYAGGAGQAFVRSNRVVLEAVLTNPQPSLPETVRLAWLLAQLNFDLPLYAEVLPGPQLARVAPLGLIPPVLAAAQDVEQVQFDQSAMELAIEAWHVLERLDMSQEAKPTAEAAATVLSQWWDVYQTGNDSLAVALRALDAMLFAGR